MNQASQYCRQTGDSAPRALNPAYFATHFRAEASAGGFPVRFGVVTAWNPNGAMIDFEENRRRNANLRTRLDELGPTYFPVAGGSPDFSHAEPGYGVVTDDLKTVLALGAEFQQEAVFWIDNGALYIAPVQMPSLQMVGRWLERL